jgi:hypothetical protein
MSLGAQPGGIGQINAFLSPIMGPWSSFLRPNALTLDRCTAGNLAWIGGLTALMSVFVPSSYLLKSRTIAGVSIGVGLLSTAIWILSGIKRVLIDLM